MCKSVKSRTPNRTIMKFRITGLTSVLLFALSLSSFSQEISKDPAVIAKGQTLFAQCTQCHRVKVKNVGPALAGFDTRVPSVKWAIDWVHNSAKLIASGDEYANKIYGEYNKTQMTSFTALSDADVLAIFAYIKSEADKPDAPAAAAGGAGQTAASGEAGLPSAYLDVILIGMLLILVIVVIILALFITGLKKFLDQRELTEEDKEVVHSPFTFWTILQSRGFVFVVVFVVGAIAFKTVIDGLYAIGVQQGYQPKQPIAFSHKLHAGKYEIDCKYCHTGAMKGKQANIPSPNMCMNCHVQIKRGSPEIAKIYAAIGFDSVTSSYTGKQKPIEWVRIHNLPDLAYFNHSQHVNVGGIQCQTCHGPIEEMDVVKQYSLLTMGWCIDCHRKTDVNSKGNAYYDKLIELHNNKAFKVEEIGGLECGKCHY